MASSEQLLLPAPPPSPRHSFKVVLIGDAGVGKSSLRGRYLTGSFFGAYRATIGVDFMAKSLEVDGTEVSLSIWDTAGQDRYRSLGSAFYRGSDAVVLVYSSPESLQSLKSWFDEFRARCPVEEGELRDFAWVAVGNKTDLWEETGDGVSPEESKEALEQLLPPAGAVEIDSVLGYSVDDSSTSSAQPNPPPDPSSPLPHCESNPSHAAEPSASSRIDVLPPLRPAFNPNSNRFPRSKRTATSIGTTNTAGTSTVSVYHDAQSTFDHPNGGSTESLASDDTITPADTPQSYDEEEEDDNSGSAVFGWSAPAQQVFLSAERDKEAARGVDAFMASSPPHTPSSLKVHEKARYRGGPSALRGRSSGSKADKPLPVARETSEERAIEQLEEEARRRDVYDYSRDGIKEFRTSAKTGEGVDEVFDYVARRALWKWKKEQEQAERRELGGEVINLDEVTKRSKWREACCS